MLMNYSDSDKLFAKSVPVSVKDVYTNQSRTTKLFLSIEWQDSSASMFSRKVLMITLTDENDPFFLYNLHLTEEDFQMLKTKQDLLISFSSFPQHIIDYIESCLLEERNPQPKFLLIFTINDKLGSGASSSKLEIVETTQFKNLIHLSLQFVAATDSATRQYLVSCFRNLKEQRCQLQNRLAFLEQDYKDKLSTCQHTLNAKVQELELLMKDHSVELTMRETKHARELQEEMTKIRNKYKEEECRLVKEYSDKERNFRQTIQQLETRVSCQETLTKELQDKNNRSESTIKELRCKLLSCEEEIRRLKDNISGYKRKCDTLNNTLKEKQSQINHQIQKIQDLEHDLRDRDHDTTRLKEQMEAEIKRKKQFEIELENAKLQLEMAEKSRVMLEEEKTKANDVILKVQDKVKTLQEKVKSKSEFSVKLDQQLKEKEKLTQQLQKETANLNNLLQAKTDELKSLNESVWKLRKNIEDMKKEMKTKEYTISYLSRQLRENGIFEKYTPQADLEDSPSAVAKRQLEQISSRSPTSPSSENSPVSSTIPRNTAPKTVRISTPTSRRNSSAANTQHKTGGTDSAYCTSPSGYSGVTPINPVRKNGDIYEEEFAIDPDALSAAFDERCHIPRHSTAKKQPLSGKPLPARAKNSSGKR